MRGRVVIAVSALALASVRCRTATVVRVETRSEVDCARRARVAVVIAHDVPGLAGAVPSAFSTTCVAAADRGDFDTGSVVLTPAGASDDTMALAVMTRPDGESPETCLDAAQANRCIIARRQMRFAPHAELTVPVELRLSCLGVMCPPDQTCRKGECVDALLSTTCGSCGEGALGTSTAPACGDVAGLQPGAPWPMAGYCPTRPGRSGRRGPRTGNVRWRFKTGGVASMAPAVAADGTIYIGSNDHLVYAVDPAGREVWRAAVPGNINDSGFVIARDGTVLVGCADGKMYAFTPAGQQRWATSVEGDIAWTPVAGGDGTIYIDGSDAAKVLPMFALGTDGAVKWRHDGPFGVSAAAIGLDGALYVGGADSALHALRRADGSEAWRSATAGNPVSPSVGSDGTVYVTDTRGLHAFAPATGAERWQFALTASSSGVALGPEDVIYIAQRDGALSAVRADGSLKWSFVSGTTWTRAPAIGSDGTAYLGGSDGGVYAISVDGTLLWKVMTGGGINSQPALGGDGTLYIVSIDSFLYAIGP